MFRRVIRRPRLALMCLGRNFQTSQAISGGCRPALFTNTAPSILQSELLVQRRFATGNFDVFYRCSECPKTFHLPGALDHHIRTRHGGKAKSLMVDKSGKILDDSKGSAAPTAAPPKPDPSKAAAPKAPTPKSATATPADPPKKAEPDQTPKTEDDEGTASPEKDKQAAVGSFTCHICQKSFRLEAGLVHHYQVRHSMEMPSASGRQPTEGQTSGESSGSSPIGSSGGAVKATGPVGDTTVPQPPQYHLDVAPNAPEESEIAAHVRCVNHMLVLGAVQDVQRGYVFEDDVLQFIVATDFEGAQPGDPEKDYHTVRVIGKDYCDIVGKELQAAGLSIVEGAGGAAMPRTAQQQQQESVRCLVSGRLRMVPQFEPTTSKYYHFPVIQVTAGSGFVNQL